MSPSLSWSNVPGGAKRYLDWEAKPGDHAITSRAIDTTGNIQPAMTDPVIAGKRTYWESNGQITRRIRIA